MHACPMFSSFAQWLYDLSRMYTLVAALSTYVVGRPLSY